MFRITHEENGKVVSEKVYNTLEEANIASSEIISEATADTRVYKKELKDYEIVEDSVCEGGNCPVKVKEVKKTTKKKAKTKSKKTTKRVKK